MGHRTLNDLDDIDKLIELAEKPKEKKVKPTKINPEIDSFISESGITSGKKKIPSYIIYYRYSAWKKTRLIPRLKFLNYFKTKFEKTKTVDGIGYLLNPKGFDLTPQGYFRARAFLRKERDEKTKVK